MITLFDLIHIQKGNEKGMRDVLYVNQVKNHTVTTESLHLADK